MFGKKTRQLCNGVPSEKNGQAASRDEGRGGVGGERVDGGEIDLWM